MDWGAQYAPSSTPWTPTSSPSASASAASSSPSVSASAVAVQGKATGSLQMYQNMTLSGLTGTCTRTGDQLQLSMSTTKYADIYSKIVVVFTAGTATKKVATVSIDLGQDSEGFTRTVSYSAAAPVTGTSATLSGSYQISGTGQAVATRHGKTTKELIPITIKATCSV